MPTVRDNIRFVLNDSEVAPAEVGAQDMLLDFIRDRARLTGTKEGCAEGDCGACTVIVGRLEGGALRYRPVNACIRPLAACDGCHVVTVEHLARDGLSPVQDAMIRHHGSQCGFCTPGIVMALHALRMKTPNPDRPAAVRALQGNLCRCTGYAPILRAAMDAEDGPDPVTAGSAAMAARLAALADGARVETGGAILPASVDDMAEVLLDHEGATIVAGATDVGLWVTKQMRAIAPAVFVGHLDALRRVERRGDALFIGAGASYSDLEPHLETHFPQLCDYWSRIGGWQVRNAGTIGGNVANGSPIGDTPPWLIAMDARMVLRRGAERREIAVEDFFIDYGRQDRRPGEFVESLSVPLPRDDEILFADKVSKRRDEDISSVAMALRLSLKGGRIGAVRIAYGGMAGTPRRAVSVEAALAGQPWTEATIRSVIARLSDDFQPLTDWRASAAYRMRVAGNLVLRAFHRHAGAGT